MFPSRVSVEDALVVEGLSKKYGTAWAVSELDLRVPRGEIVGLIGPNGAGKTTTLKSIVGLLRPDAGRVYVDGHDLEMEPLAYKAASGYMPETLSLPEYLSAQEFLDYVARLHDVPEASASARIRDGPAGGSGVLVSTHMLDTAERLCDHLAIMRRGHAIAHGTLPDLRGVAHAGKDATLEEVFLQLTEEARSPPTEEPPRRRGLFGRRR